MKKNKPIALTLFFLFYFCFGLPGSPGKTTGKEKPIKTNDDFVKKWPVPLELLTHTFSSTDDDDLDKLKFPGRRTNRALQEKMFPTFSTLLSDYYEEETGLIYNYSERWREIFDPWSIVSPRKKKKKKEKPEPAFARPYDPRTLPYIYQSLATAESLNWEPGNGPFDPIPMELLDMFPLDKDDEAVGFLKNYTWFSPSNRWVDAACILSTFLSRGELERFAAALNAVGKREKANHLLELAHQPCGQLVETAAQNMERLFYFPLEAPGLAALAGINKRKELYYTGDVIEKSYTAFMTEELEHLSKQEVNGQSRSLKKIVKHGTLLKKLFAMHILAGDKTLPDRFFKKFLHARGGGTAEGWLRLEALQALRRRGAALSKDRLETLLGSPDPFAVFYALYWVEKDDKERFGDTLKQLARRGRSVFQKNALKALDLCFGYSELKAAVSYVKEENLSTPSLKYYLQKAFENKDKAVLVRRFNIKEKPEIMIPAVYALFALDRQETLVNIRQFLTKEYYYFRDKKGYRMDDWVMEHLLTLVADSPVRTDIRPLTVFINKGFFVNESKKALVYMVPAITEKDIKWMEGVLSPSRLSESMARFYKPEFLPYLKRCLKGGESGLAESMLKSGHEDLKPLWRHHIKREEREAPPGEKVKMLKAVFIVNDFNRRRSFIDDVTEMENDAAVEELTWCVENGDDFTALYAMRALLDYPGSRGRVGRIDRIDGLMTERLRAADEFMKVPAITWFARRGDVSVLPVLESLLYKHPVPRYILVDELVHFPPSKTLPIVVNMIRARFFDVWVKIDRVLKVAAETHPRLLARFIDQPDIEVKKKILGALKHAKGFNGWKNIRKYLKSENTPLALYAFEALGGREKWRKKDLKALTSLYRRIKSPTVKVDILGAVGRINTPAARRFLRAAGQSDPLFREYADLYVSFSHKKKLVSLLKVTGDINIFRRGARYLRTHGRDGSCAAFITDMLRDDNEIPGKFSNRLETLFQPAGAEPAKEKPPVTIGIPGEIKTVSHTAAMEIPTLAKGNTRIDRTFQFKDGFAHLWKGALTTEKDRRVHVSLSADLEKWSVPASFSETMRMEDPSLIELPGGRYLVYYLKCTDPNVLSQPRPFFRILNKEGRFEEGYFPLKNSLTFSEITIFRRNGNYYMAAITERGCYGVKKRIQVYVSRDLENWSTDAEHIDFLENVHSLNLRSFTGVGHFLLSRDNLYHSDDLFHWKRVHTFDDYYFTDLVKLGGKYCAVLVSDRYGFWETYLSFSGNLRQWSAPVYTGKPAVSGLGVIGGRLLLFYGRRAETLDLDTIMVDTDGDGLTDVEEEILFTRNDRKDTDGDGVPDGEDLNPLRKPSPTLTVTMEIRRFLLEYYLERGGTFGLGGLLIVISDSAETQCFENVKMKTLSFNPTEYGVYYNRFKHRGDFFRIGFSRIDLSKDGKSAVVEMSYHYAGLAAAGYEVKLKKVNNKWKVLRFRTTWIS